MSVVTNNSAPSVPTVKTLSVSVNGRRLEVPLTMPNPLTGQPAPTTMIQACEIAGVTVPHYCYHAKLPVAGNCRMCLVEFGTPALGPDRKPVLNPDGTPQIRKSPRPAIACATPVSPGMEIYTNTPAVEAMRRGVLEFLLLNHPLDCPICDQAGECKLQEYSVEYGQAASRSVDEKVHKPKQVDLGPRLVLDDERCILCSRCIRFTRDLAGDDALGIVQRGSHSTLTHYPGRPFDHNYTLNTVDICPVGALTSKDFRFQMRVWFLKESKSVCTSCATGCNLLIGSRANKIYRYVPRQNDLVNSCWMCDSGRLNYKWIGRSDRLTQCQVRDAQGQMQPRTWPEAIQEVAARLKQAAPGSIAFIASARQTNEELFLISHLARKLGATIDSAPRTGEGDNWLVNADKNPNSLGARLMFGQPIGAKLPKMAEGIGRGEIRTLMVLGEDATKHLGAELLGRLDNLMVSDILPNATTQLAHVLLPGCAHAEKRGSFTNAKGRVQKFMKAVEPPGQARPESEFLVELVCAVTGEQFPQTVEGRFNRMARETSAFQGLTWAGLGDLGQEIAPGALKPNCNGMA
jgi:NADH-quinone oxidoreductase subunit G